MDLLTYKLVYKRSVEKDLRDLNKEDRIRIVGKIIALAKEPFPPSCIKLHGSSNIFRIRCGDYRIIYQIQNEELILLIIKVGHRQEVYRKG